MTNNTLAAALITVLVVLPAALASAQTEAAKPAGMKLEQGNPAAAEDKTMKTAAATGKRPARVNEDARHCLELPTTAEIVKCAEPYRY